MKFEHSLNQSKIIKITQPWR